MKSQKFISIGLLAIFVLGGVAYLVTQFMPKKTSPTQDQPATQPEIKNKIPVSVPDFNADSSYLFIEKQVAFGPRIPGTPAQAKCAEWLSAKFKSYHATVSVQDLQVQLWNNKTVPCKNIVASFNPDLKKRILLGAHWDTRPWSDRDTLNPKKTFPGADDGGSGVAILLEVSRQLSAGSPAVGVDIVLFDVEDYGPPQWDPASQDPDVQGYCLGSQEWASEPHVPGYRAYYGILLDMTGAGGAQFRQEGTSLEYAPSIVSKVWNTASSLGYSNYFIYEKIPPIMDDHVHINRINGTPCIDIINLDRNTKTGFAPHWHTQQDNMDIIDKNTLKAVGQTLLTVIYSESADLN